MGDALYTCPDHLLDNGEFFKRKGAMRMKHPSEALHELLDGCGVRFVSYTEKGFGGRSRDGENREHHITAGFRDWRELNQPNGCELAITSQLWHPDDGKLWCLPMVDLICDAGKLPDFKEALPRTQETVFGFDPIVVLSGASYHLYWPVLKPMKVWPFFLGALLQDWRNAEQKVVDLGWVTASLNRGYGALRWSGNNKPEPVVVESF